LCSLVLFALRHSHHILLTLQGTLAADIGLGTEIEVGTNVEALAISRPFFYTLNKFELDAFVRIRVFVGLNSALTNVVRKVQDLAGSNEIECRFIRGPFKIPELPNREPETPIILEQALEEANNSSKFTNEISIDLAELLGDFDDGFSPGRGALQGQSLGV